MQNYEDYIKQFPDFAPAYNNLSVLRAFKHDYAGAEVLLRRALQLQPTYVNACRNLAEVYGAQGDRTKQLEYLDKAIAAAKDSEKPSLKLRRNGACLGLPGVMHLN